MKFIIAVAVLATAGAVSAQNVVEFKINKGVPGLRAPKPLPKVVGRMFGKRDTATSLIVNNITGGGYYINVEVGTPGQRQSMVLDTGSSDAWVVSHEADLCDDKYLQRLYSDTCSLTYDSSKSSTYEMAVQGGFEIAYLDGSKASGDYIKDDFKIAGVTIKALQIAVADTTGMGIGVLGIGFPANEAARVKYPNIIDELAMQGLIGARAYSLYLNDRRSPTGNILFGGIDQDKFIGDLKTLPILKSAGANYTHLAVRMTGLKAETDGKTTTGLSSTTGLPAILDSGTTLSYVPDDVSAKLINGLGAYTDYQETGLTLIDCKFLRSNLTITFTFGTGTRTATIAVPVHEMVLDQLRGLESFFPDDVPFSNICLFGLQTTETFGDMASTALLGDTFLRSAYVVYDLDNKEIGLAQANLNSTETNIYELNSTAADATGGALPLLTGVARQQTSVSAMPSPTQSVGMSGTGSGSDKETVTVTATPSDNAAAGLRQGGSMDILAVIVLSSLLSVFGGVMFML